MRIAITLMALFAPAVAEAQLTNFQCPTSPAACDPVNGVSDCCRIDELMEVARPQLAGGPAGSPGVIRLRAIRVREAQVGAARRGDGASLSVLAPPICRHFNHG